MLAGKFLIILGGWFDFTLIYRGILSGLLQVLYLPVVKSSVTSKKFKISRLASQAILSWNSYLNILIKSFLILSAGGPQIFLKQAKPSSLYKPLRSFPYLVLGIYKI